MTATDVPSNKELVRICIKNNIQLSSMCSHHKSMRAAPKLMPQILLHWPTTSEANFGDMAVEVEPSRQYSTTFCCHMTDGI